MSDSDIISSLGLALSLFAFFVSIKSYSVAKKSLNISEQQNNERKLGVHLYYIDAYKWKKEDDVFISFALRITNKSTIRNTISKIELHIEYRDKNNVVGKIKLQTNISVTPVNLKNFSEKIITPLCLEEKSAKSGWITFKLPHHFKEQLTIDLYQVIAESIDNETISIDTHIINEV